MAYDNVRRTKPDDGYAHLAVGYIYLDDKQLDEAREAFSKASGVDDTRVDGLAGLAEVFYEQGNLEAALEQYGKVRRERPKDRRFVVAEREIREELEIKRAQESTASR